MKFFLRGKKHIHSRHQVSLHPKAVVLFFIRTDDSGFYNCLLRDNGVHAFILNDNGKATLHRRKFVIFLLKNEFDWNRGNFFTSSTLFPIFATLNLSEFKAELMSKFVPVTCADPEGGTGGPDPPWNLKILPKKK